MLCNKNYDIYILTLMTIQMYLEIKKTKHICIVFFFCVLKPFLKKLIFLNKEKSE